MTTEDYERRMDDLAKQIGEAIYGFERATGTVVSTLSIVRTNQFINGKKVAEYPDVEILLDKPFRS